MYHEMVEAGQEQYLKATGEKVRVIKVELKGVLDIVLPDHENGGHGGTVRVKGGDFLVGREDGSVFGVPADRYAETISQAPAAVPTLSLEKK